MPTGIYKRHRVRFERECLNCKKIFEVHRHRKDTAKYCSKKCLNSSELRNNAISHSLTGKNFSESHRKNIGLSGLGRKVTLETKIKQSESIKKHLPSTAYKKGQEAVGTPFKKGHQSWNDGLTKETDERVKKISEGLKRDISNQIRIKKMWENKEFKERMKEIHRKNWSNPEFARDVFCNNFKKRINKFEVKIFNILQEFDKNFEYVGDGNFWIGYPPKNPDFVLREQRIIIEAFGYYWHKNDDVLDYIKHYKKYGFDCLIIWDYELKDIDKLKEKISQFLKLNIKIKKELFKR